MCENLSKYQKADNFGENVFSRKVMKSRLEDQIYEEFDESTKNGGTVSPRVAKAIAEAMKSWAIEKGATHYTHWFQPLTGITAGKFDSFLKPNDEGEAIYKFSEKALFKGEPDASSFPTGGLRVTFEARGYTTWDPTSPAFVKGTSLYIPTAFCSYTGEALDMKTPLLRSMNAVNRSAVRLCHALNLTNVKKVTAQVGAEQEYFIVNRELYEQRLDLKICGTTLIGARTVKGQELDDHYFGRIRIKIDNYMREVDKRLWELGVPAQTKHNESAPAQHELACMYRECNLACDHNQIVMETLRTVAKEQGLACLLHEKPFAGINGSGKHNNYSLVTDNGINVFDQGKNPQENNLFIISLCAFIRAIDKYPDLLRLSATSVTNDKRLGGSEAPPTIISMFLGQHLVDLLNDIAKGAKDESTSGDILDIGVPTSAFLSKDDSDRNRTSPIAFTGNKFEFRMVGSSQSIAMANTVLNTVMADSFDAYSEYFEEFGYSDKTVSDIVAETMKNHSKIIFNGNNYDVKWKIEAERRGLSIINNAVEGFEALLNSDNIELLSRYHVLSKSECQSRYDIMTESYSKIISIEGSTLLEMVKRQIIPAIIKYIGVLSKTALDFVNVMGYPESHICDTLRQLSTLLDSIGDAVASLEELIDTQPKEHVARSKYMCNMVLPAMDNIRKYCDKAEAIVDKKYWAIPTYNDLIHKV